MSEFHPYFTNDGSVGLYSENFNDIYHSATGALSEAYEKFIYPIDFENLLKKDSIKVLDICYGIGYNTKSFLNFIFEKFILKNSQKNFAHAENNIATIYDDNIYHNKSYYYSEKIYTNNIFNKISVTAIDNDKILSFLSPFLKTGVKNFSNKNLDFEYKPIKKYFDKSSKNFPKINKLVNFLILEEIAKKQPEIFENKEFNSILSDKKYREFFDPVLTAVYAHKKLQALNYNHKSNLFAFLHNIYYNHISTCYKNDLKRYQLSSVNFEIKNDDARKILKNDRGMYNLIFLDAFTPKKCPCLWTYEFFKLLYDHLEPDGMILTYVTSAAVRAAMIEAGFCIGYNQLKGTIATKNKSFIKYPLSKKDLGLLKTRAGIFYRDRNLTGLNDEILAAREIEVKNSNRVSSSSYLAGFKE